jgi:Predicted membrane protein
MTYFPWLSPDGERMVFVLFLSFLIGLEREERKSHDSYAFGGVRAFPLIGLIGYAMAALSNGELLPQVLGFAVVAGFLVISYWHKLSRTSASGVASEMSGLVTYLVGVLVYREMFWIATTLTVASLLLLELKARLEALAQRIETTDILNFAKFLLLSAVILPLLPDTPFSKFQINPFKIWLVVVAVSAVSYGSYVLQRLTKGQGGILLSALLGGAYSSTVTTVVLARRAKQEEQAYLFSGSILIASGVMYLRLAILLALFNRELMSLLAPPFMILAVVAIVTGWLWSKLEDKTALKERDTFEAKNPLEISTALLFAALFVTMLIATHLAITYLGENGVYTLASIMGVTDVDPFIMGMTQSDPSLTPIHVAASGILVAAASNNVAKGIYAYALSSRRVGMQSLFFLLALALCGLIPMFL